MESADEVAACLRSWRDRLTPEACGLPSGPGRRAPGLRREELAGLAGVSLDYLSRLEQGRARNPSPAVLGALARALRLSDDERAHLFRVAGHADPVEPAMRRHLTPGVQRILDRLADVPVTVIDAAWTVVAANPLATALMGDRSGRPWRERNILWAHFTGAAGRVERTPEEVAAFDAEAVADLHQALGRHPGDRRLGELVSELRAASPRFARLWAERPVAVRQAARKRFVHPEVGELVLDCDVLAVAGSDLRLIVYTAEPGSPAASSLALLAAVGLQTFADAAVR